MSDQDVAELRHRIGAMDDKGLYLADVARALFDPAHPKVLLRAEEARDRILQRPAPVPGITRIGNILVPDSYQVSRAPGLDDDRKACLERLLAIAGDPREAATTRRDALTAARNLAVDRSERERRHTFRIAADLVRGDNSADHPEDAPNGSPHPLSAGRVDLGSGSLRGPAPALAAAAASGPDQHAWVRDRATELLRSHDEHDVHEAAAALCRLPADTVDGVDPGLLAAHGHFAVRQAGAVLCMRFPLRHHGTALNLTRDPDVRVRLTLTEAAANAATEDPEVEAVRRVLREDPRHRVRALAGPRRSGSGRAAPGRPPS